MSGHSKWHNIKIKKGKVDQQRGKLFSKLAREIIIAAEVLKQYLVAIEASMAVELIETGSETSRRYVIARSGFAENLATASVPTLALEIDFAAASHELTRRLNFNASFVHAQTAYELYQPMNDTAAKLLDSAQIGPSTQLDPGSLASFLGEIGEAMTNDRSQARRIEQRRAAQREEAAQRAKAGLRPQRQAAITWHERQVTQPQLERLVAVCIALRLNKISAAARALVCDELKALLVTMREGSSAPAMQPDIYARLASALESIALKKIAIRPALSLTKEEKKAFPYLGDLITAASTAILDSRFCAEPRAFSHLSKRSIDGYRANVRSQVCFWWGGEGAQAPATPKSYRVIGPRGKPTDASLSGSYMWPCSSCRNRSSDMMNGLAAASTYGRRSSLF